jgi:transcriptional regulator with XRE-family HTH domain
MSNTDQILSEFIDAWNAGARPRVRDYLARAPAGADRDDLAAQLTTWLEVAPTPGYSEATRAEIRAEPVVRRVLAAADDDAGLWPSVVPALRERAGLTVREVASRLVARFMLGDSQSAEPRTAEYLERLERGDLEPSRVSRRLLDALADLLGASPGTLRDAGALGGAFRPAAAGGTLFRADDDRGSWVADDVDAISRAAMAPAPAPLDELDRLFVGGPEG